MRDYQYIWRPSENSLVNSGLEFSDLRPILRNSQFVLLKHQTADARFDPRTRFEYIPGSEINDSDDEIYSWGDFVFAVTRNNAIPHLDVSATKDLLYFSHTGIWHSSLQDKGFIGGIYIHDNGWLLKFTGDKDTAHRLHSIVQAQTTDRIDHDKAYLICAGKAHHVEGTFDIDKILNSDLRRIEATQS